MNFHKRLSMSPVYVDLDALQRNGACQWAQNEFRQAFGENAKVPVTRHNFLGVDRAGFDWLNAGWLAERFLGPSDQYDAWNDYIAADGGRTYADCLWPYVERELRRRFPEWYAAKEAR